MDKLGYSILRWWITVPRWIKQSILWGLALYGIMGIFVKGVIAIGNFELGTFGIDNLILCIVASFIVFSIIKIVGKKSFKEEQ